MHDIYAKSMYLLNKCNIDNNGLILSENADVPCMSHLHLLASSLEYVSNKFKLKAKRHLGKYALMLRYNGFDAEVIGFITRDAIYDKFSKKLMDITDLQTGAYNCSLYEIDIENGDKNELFYYTSNISKSGVKLLQTMVLFHASLMNTALASRFYRKCELRNNKGLVIQSDITGLYDNEGNKLLDFSTFYVPKILPKRIRDNTHKFTSNDNRI